MNASTFIKKATKSNEVFLTATARATEAEREREQFLEEALPHVSNVTEAVAIIALSNDKDTFSLAWKKAVVLLGTSGKSLADLLLIKKSKFHAGTKEYDVLRDLNQKEDLIVSKATDEELLFQLFVSNHFHYREQLSAQFARLAPRCNTLDDLNTLSLRYTSANCYIENVLLQHRARIIEKCEEKAAEFSRLAPTCRSYDELDSVYSEFLPWLSDSLNAVHREHCDRLRKAKEES